MDPNPRYASDLSNNNSAIRSIKKPMYKCNYCPKSYSNNQALGGHQNAHKKEREITKRQMRVNQPNSYLCLYPNPFPIWYPVPSGFEKRCDNIDGPNNIIVGYNQYTWSPSTNFARLHIKPNPEGSVLFCIDQTQEMDLEWVYNMIQLQPGMTQPQPHPPATSPVCLDLWLGIGCSYKIKALPKKPKYFDDKEDHLSLKL